MKNLFFISGLSICLLMMGSNLFAQTSDKQDQSSKKTWEKIQKDYKKQLDFNKDSIIIGFREGLQEAQQLFKDMKIKDNGDITIDGETINIVEPMQGLVEGLAKMSESLGTKSEDLKGLKELDQVFEGLPKMLQQTIEIFGEALSGLAKTDNPNSKKEQRTNKNTRSM